MEDFESALFAGSRLHVLDWVAGRSGDFLASLNSMLQPTGCKVPAGGTWLPKGYSDATEALLDRPCEPLLPSSVSRRLRAWWLAVDRPTASGPNWDLAASALFPGSRPGLVLVEAKAHVGELEGEEGGKRLAQSSNAANHARIGEAIAEARAGLGGPSVGVSISRDLRYQLSNRIAFAWKLNQEGIPVVLVYLGFTGDNVIGLLSHPIRDAAHWLSIVAEHAAPVLPAEYWERDIGRPDTPLWIVARSLPVARQSPEQRGSRRRRTGPASGDVAP